MNMNEIAERPGMLWVKANVDLPGGAIQKNDHLLVDTQDQTPHESLYFLTRPGGKAKIIRCELGMVWKPESVVGRIIVIGRAEPAGHEMVSPGRRWSHWCGRRSPARRATSFVLSLRSP